MKSVYRRSLGNSELIQELIHLIHKNPEQAISFRDFMENCLYHPSYGYYMQSNPKIGREGDFYTSSHLGTWLGDGLARFFLRMIEEHYPNEPRIEWIEWGGGTGRLALHLLDACLRLNPTVYQRIHVVMVEPSPFHQAIQKQSLRQHQSKISWLLASNLLSTVPAVPRFVLANELLDAFAVHKIRRNRNLFEECYVTWETSEQQFREKWVPLDNPEMTHHLRSSDVKLANGQIVEVNVAATQWIQACAQSLAIGFVVIIDYGDIANRLWASAKMEGTLRAYRQHQVHSDVYHYCGEQDLTADVNFSACMQVALEYGFVVHRYQTQSEFLLEQGILERLQDHTEKDPFHEVARQNRMIRQLLWSSEWSEKFKVLILHKTN